MTSPDDTWFVAESIRDGRVVVIRGRRSLNDADPATHSELLKIQWKYEPHNDSGLPSPELNRRMGEFEDVLFEALEADRLCVFFCVYMHDGLKEWCAYTTDVSATGQRINAALANSEPLPLQLSLEDDPEWNEFQQMLAGVNLNE